MIEPRPLTESELASLRRAYSHFLKEDRVLLTGHSHQAWPDCARTALTDSFDDAARFVDDKWEDVVFEKMESLGRGILRRAGFDEEDHIAFGKSTHELVQRLLSCLNPCEKPRIVTTTAEFHSLRRQLLRLEEAGASVVWVNAEPRSSLPERIDAELREGTAVLALSSVFFEDAYVLREAPELAAKALEMGAIPLIDAYHAFNVVPLEWGTRKADLFVTAGGYKYAAMGEGACWLRIPKDCSLRPCDTGWFSDFGALTDQAKGRVGYGERGARFAGATFDPTSFYRAHAVLQHWESCGLTPARLRSLSLFQTQHLIQALDKGGFSDALVSSRDGSRRGGFVAVRVPDAQGVVKRLREKGVFVDARGGLLRIGPAPYLSLDELDRGMEALVGDLRALRAG